MKKAIMTAAVGINDTIEDVRCTEMLVVLLNSYPSMEDFVCTWTAVETHCIYWDATRVQRGTIHGQAT